MSIDALRSRTALCAALLVAGLGLAGLANAQSAACAANEVTQNLDQGANPWTSGSLTYAANIGAGASAVTVNGSITAGNISAGYPQNELTGGIADTFGYAVNRTNTAQSNTITFTFSKPLNNLRLIITDIDRNTASGSTYSDEVTITGTAPGGGAVTPTATAASTLVTIAGNVAFPSGSASSATNCPFSSGNCNATFNFSAPITSLTIVYANRTPPAAGNPPEQQVSSSFGGFCVQNPNPSVTKTAPASATVGTAFDFVLRASNPGSAATGTTPTGVQINDTIDANRYTINSIVAGAGWSCTPNSGFPINTGSVAITCTSGAAIAAGVANQLAATINVTPKVAAMPGPIPNTATIPAGSGGDIDSANNSSSTSTTLALPQADLTVAKTNTPLSGPNDQPVDTVDSGTATGYTIVVTNNGPATATGAVIQDVPVAGIDCPPANAVTCSSAAPGACPAGALTVADLAAGIVLGTLPATAGSNTATFAFSCTVQ